MIHQDLEIQKNIEIGKLTTFKLKVMGNLFIAKSIEGVKFFLNWAKENNMSYFLLGHGANTVITTKDLNFLKLDFPFEKSSFTIITLKILSL